MGRHWLPVAVDYIGLNDYHDGEPKTYGGNIWRSRNCDGEARNREQEGAAS